MRDIVQRKKLASALNRASNFLIHHIKKRNFLSHQPWFEFQHVLCLLVDVTPEGGLHGEGWIVPGTFSDLTILCNMQMAWANLQTFSGAHWRVPPDLSRQRNLDLSNPNALNYDPRFRMRGSALLFGSITGVKSQGFSGYPLSPSTKVKTIFVKLWSRASLIVISFVILKFKGHRMKAVLSLFKFSFATLSNIE